jgi:hypothetical protein
MQPILKAAFEKEMSIAKDFYEKKDYTTSFRHLERAHVLGQRNAIEHTINHWWMLKVGFRNRDGREIIGQMLRIAVAGLGSLIGRAPVGNTGGANVGILSPMPIPQDLAAIFRSAGMKP